MRIKANKAIADIVQRIPNFTYHRMNFKNQEDWIAFIQQYHQKEGLFYVDPAWPNTGMTQYDVMDVRDIYNMPIEHVFLRGVCFMWVIKSAVNVGIQIMKKWGFEYKDLIVWRKID